MRVLPYVAVSVALLGASILGCKTAPPVEAGAHALASAKPQPEAGLPDAGVPANVGTDGGPSDASAHDAALITDDETAVPMTSEELVARSKHLVEAVAGDNPELAMDFLLSKDAYAQFYAEKDLTRAWERHMKRAFARAIHRLHRRRHSKDAKFARFELGTRLVKGPVGKGKHRHHVWHAHGSRIFYTVDGREHPIAIREMIAWRGAWYISRLR
jgi:hypothetical protein